MPRGDLLPAAARIGDKDLRNVEPALLRFGLLLRLLLRRLSLLRRAGVRRDIPAMTRSTVS